MATVKITKRTVDAVTAKPMRYTIFDSAIPGFGLRVYPSGKKSWVFEYRPGEGGRRTAKKRITIGNTRDFTPDRARKLADDLRSRVKTGSDPQGEKGLDRKAMTVEELSAEFLASHVLKKRKPSTAAHYSDIINRLIVPAIGKTKAKDLKRPDLARLHLANSRTPFQANRILATVGSMFSFGAKHGLVPDGLNPGKGIERFAERGSERFLSVIELEALGTAIRAAETTGVAWHIRPDGKTKHVPKMNQKTNIDQFAAGAIRLLIFTGARLREILHLEWKEVDLERGLLLLADSKTGKKTIVLNAPAIAVLASLPRIGRYAIAGESAGTDKERPRSDLKRPWAMVLRQAGLTRIRIHDLRHTFAAFGAGGGLGLPIIGKLLGHANQSTTQRYAHLDADPVRKAANAIGIKLSLAMGQKEDDANVVSLSVKRIRSS